MESFWTSKESLHGLKHFVVVNKYKEKNEFFYEIVSVLDDSISLKISKIELQKSNKWDPGFIDYNQSNISSNDYKEFKLKYKKENISKILVKKTSPFYIS